MIDLDKVKDFKVLLVGDAIMDEYVYVRVVGKAIKESALSSMRGKTESYLGGVHAAARHVMNFCGQVNVFCGPNMMFNSRLVDDVYLRKLFVIHEMKMNAGINQAGDCQDLPDVRDYDLVIVTDFGNGLLTQELIQKLTKEARYLVVNAQTNATNFGFNMITKYPRADLVVLDELEARLATHDKDSSLEDVILELGFKKIIVTRGTKGAIGFDGAFERAPAVTDVVKDTMGAGDAFLSVVSPFAAAGFSMKDLLKIGNAAGAIKVGIIGHSSSVTKSALFDALVRSQGNGC